MMVTNIVTYICTYFVLVISTRGQTWSSDYNYGENVTTIAENVTTTSVPYTQNMSATLGESSLLNSHNVTDLYLMHLSVFGIGAKNSYLPSQVNFILHLANSMENLLPGYRLRSTHEVTSKVSEQLGFNFKWEDWIVVHVHSLVFALLRYIFAFQMLLDFI